MSWRGGREGEGICVCTCMYYREREREREKVLEGLGDVCTERFVTGDMSF